MESKTYEFARLMLSQYYWAVSFPFEAEGETPSSDDDVDNLPRDLINDEFMIASMIKTLN